MRYTYSGSTALPGCRTYCQVRAAACSCQALTEGYLDISEALMAGASGYPVLIGTEGVMSMVAFQLARTAMHRS